MDFLSAIFHLIIIKLCIILPSVTSKRKIILWLIKVSSKLWREYRLVKSRINIRNYWERLLFNSKKIKKEEEFLNKLLKSCLFQYRTDFVPYFLKLT